MERELQIDYWVKHKEIYNKFLNELDAPVIKKIMKTPDCNEARELDKKVDKELKEIGY